MNGGVKELWETWCYFSIEGKEKGRGNQTEEVEINGRGLTKFSYGKHGGIFQT